MTLQRVLNQSCVISYFLSYLHYAFLPTLVTIYRPTLPLPIDSIAVFLLTPILLLVGNGKQRTERRARSITENKGTGGWAEGLSFSSAFILCVNTALAIGFLYKFLVSSFPPFVFLTGHISGTNDSVYGYLYPGVSSVPLPPLEYDHVKTTINKYARLESVGLWTGRGWTGFAMNTVGIACCVPALLSTARHFLGFRFFTRFIDTNHDNVKVRRRKGNEGREGEERSDLHFFKFP